MVGVQENKCEIISSKSSWEPLPLLSQCPAPGQPLGQQGRAPPPFRHCSSVQTAPACTATVQRSLPRNTSGILSCFCSVICRASFACLQWAVTLKPISFELPSSSSPSEEKSLPLSGTPSFYSLTYRHMSLLIIFSTNKIPSALTPDS